MWLDGTYRNNDSKQLQNDIMIQIEIISFVTALVTLQLALIFYIWGFVSIALGEKAVAGTAQSHSKSVTRFAFPVLIVAWIALTVSLISRSIVTGHVPFTDMYEFTVSFSWGIMAASLLFQWRLRAEIIGAGGAIMALALLVYAFILPSQHAPLVPALRHGLLPLHVSCAIIAYGMFALGFAAAILYLIRQKYAAFFLPALETLDKAGYLAVIIGFPFMTLVIILGSIWANIAWGSYWSWDPKETASLVTWLIYAGYLLTRVWLRWRNTRSAWLLIIGFIAVLVTFFGNYFFGGLHSYV